MPSLDDLSERIRSYLAAKDREWSQELSDTSASYAVLCRDANDRIRRCADYLRRGMRSEAVHLAGCQPPLFDLIEALRLPDHAAWARDCVRNGLPAPPELLTRLSDPLRGDFETARSDENRLEPLLGRHRLLALARSPTRDRLEVLLALAEQDAGNPCWPREIQSLEAIRLKELRAEARAAFREKDLTASAALWQELTGRAWRAQIPSDLRAGVERAVASLRLDEAMAEIREILPLMNACREADDVDGCADQLTRWQRLIEERHLTLTPDLQGQIRPLLQWLEHARRRRETNRRLQAAGTALLVAGNDPVLWGPTRRRRALIALAVAACLVVGVVTAIHFWPHLSP